MRLGGCKLWMRGWVTVSGVYRTLLQAANEIYMLRESRGLQLAQRYFAHYGDDIVEPNKPCLGDQINYGMH